MESVEGHRGRRGRWVVLALLLAIAVWAVRSWRSARAESDTGWPPPPLEEADAAPPAPAPQPQAAPAPPAEPAPRRPSPRPRPAPAG